MAQRPYVKALHSDIFRRSVVVMVGELDDAMRHAFMAELRGRADTKVIREGWDKVVAACRETWEECHYLGVTTHVGGDTYIHLPKWQTPVFVHEAYHAMRYVMKDIDAEDEEVSALLIEWIFEEICLGDRRPGPMKEKTR